MEEQAFGVGRLNDDAIASAAIAQLTVLFERLPLAQRQALAAIIGVLHQAARTRVPQSNKAPGLGFFERHAQRLLVQLTRIRSVLELCFFGLLDEANLASEFDVNEPLRVPFVSLSGQETVGTTTPDFVHRRLRIAIYCDGATYHSSDTERERDSGVDAALQAAGWRVLRFSSRAIWLHPRKCLGEVQRALRELAAHQRAKAMAMGRTR